MMGRRGENVTTSVFDRSLIFPGSQDVQLRLFHIRSTAILFPVRQSRLKYDLNPVLTHSYFERVERDRISNMVNLHDRPYYRWFHYIIPCILDFSFNLDHRLRRPPNIKPTLDQRIVTAEYRPRNLRVVKTRHCVFLDLRYLLNM